MIFVNDEHICSKEFMKRLSIKRSKFYLVLSCLIEGVDYAHVGNEYYFFWSKNLLLKLTKSSITRSKSSISQGPPQRRPRINGLS